MKVEPYNAIDPSLIKQRAQLVRNNEKFSQNILTALREIAEEKEQSKSQEDIYAEESIYTKFTSNKDTALFQAWHAASWKDKLILLDKFEDERLVEFGKKIIYQVNLVYLFQEAACQAPNREVSLFDVNLV